MKRLAHGAEAWNAWRSTRPAGSELDLVGASLAGADLRGIDLSGANLMGADFAKADLEGANLSNAILTGADLRECNLEHVRGRDAMLSYAKLEGARLTGADFAGSTTERTGGIRTFYPEGQGPLGVVPDAVAPSNETLEMLFRGVEAWNRWREDNPDEKWPELLEARLPGARLPGINLDGALLAGSDLSGANLSGASLREAVFEDANLGGADLSGADLTGASMSLVRLSGAKLVGATLVGADLSGADAGYAKLTGADLTGANLEDVELNKADIDGAVLTGCRVHGVATWGMNGTPADQSDLIITPSREPALTVDNLEVAQFIYLLLNNEKVRDVIDTITSRVVLILGRFSEQRIKVLQALRTELRKRGYSPILFDFDKPRSKDVTGTVETLARMARFIIADLTDPSSIPHELATVVPHLRTTPVQALRLAGSGGYSMFDDFAVYPWVLEVHEYADAAALIGSLDDLIAPVDALAEKLRR